MKGLNVAFGVVTAASLVAAAGAESLHSAGFVDHDDFSQLIMKAEQNNWRALPMGELVGKVAKEFEGTPYMANTLEVSDDEEVCSVNLTGMDCVTFYETSLDTARMIKKRGRKREDLLNQIEVTRYRGGKLTDYTSRLHYTKDWLLDNQSRGIISILNNLPGAVRLPNKVSFMSSNPKYYGPLRAHPELIAKIAKQERAINSRQIKYVPLASIAKVEPLLRTGDIVAITTSVPGLDTAHTGLIYRTADGVAHFMDASSKKAVMKVVVEPGPLSETLRNGPKTWTGAIFARPLEPK